MGFYPVCPGTTEYLIGSPLFDRATITLPDGKNFVIQTKTNGPQRPYIRRAALNGKEFNRTFLDHAEITQGGRLDFEMTSAPEYKWATQPASRPASALEKVTR